MLGTFVNAIAIIVGTLVGASLGAKIQERYSRIVMRFLGLVTMFLGVQMLAGFSNIIVPILSLLGGSALGYSLHIDRAINNFVSKLSKHGQGGRGFIVASVLFCVGPMSIIGSLEDGLHNNPSILLTKAGLDGVSSVALSATFGISVMLSALLVFLLQGSITLASTYASSFLTHQLVSNLTTTGGALVLVIAANLLGFDKLKVENLLPSLLMVAILSLLNLP